MPGLFLGSAGGGTDQVTSGEEFPRRYSRIDVQLQKAAVPPTGAVAALLPALLAAFRALTDEIVAGNARTAADFGAADMVTRLKLTWPPAERARARGLAEWARAFYASGVSTPRLRDRPRKMDDQLVGLR